MHGRKALITLIISLLPAFPAAGYDYLVEHFSCPEGLSDSNVMAMECDDNGIIWAGTHNGLNRYDGHRFKHYSLPAGHNIIRHLCIDDEGMVWASTSWGVFRLNPWSEAIDSPVSGCQINQIANIGDGNIAVVTSENGILVINPRGLSRKSIDFPAKALTIGGSDIYVLGKDDELYVTDRTFGRFVKFETAGDLHPFAENGGTKVPAIILGVISAVLCYLILFEFWRVTDNVGKNNTFTRDNVKYFGKMAVLVLALAISWLIFGVAWLIAGYGISLMAVFQLGFDVIIFSGISMLCSIFSKLLEKACEIREENDLTI